MIASTLLADVAAAVAEAPAGLADGDLQRSLRERFSGLRVVVCADDDVPLRVAPAFGNAHCKLYYLAAGEHCAMLTGEAAAASGLVVGLRGEDAD